MLGNSFDVCKGARKAFPVHAATYDRDIRNARLSVAATVALALLALAWMWLR